MYQEDNIVITDELLDELWLDMSFTKDYIKHKYEFYKLAEEYNIFKQRIEETIEYIEHEWFKRQQLGITRLDFSYEELQDILSILRGEE